MAAVWRVSAALGCACLAGAREAAVLNLSCTRETAVLNLLRHGEKCEGSGTALADAGKARAEYLARCMASGSRSSAMPFGAATAVVASKKSPTSTRPYDTVRPLADALGLEVEAPCLKDQHERFAEHVRTHLADLGTVVAAWQHTHIPSLLEALGVRASVLKDFEKWPGACPSASWPEPSCCLGGSTCYEEIWHVRFSRDDAESSWRAVSVARLREGFRGAADGPCDQGLAPERG